MNGLYVIDTVATITAVHQAFAVAAQMPHGIAREQLIADANAALSVASYYVRYPRVQAQKKHYDSVQRLLRMLSNYTEST
jgi:cytochrome c